MAKRLARLATPPASALALPVFFGALASGAQVALLATSAWLITRASEQPPILYLTLAVVAVRAFALSRATFRYLERIAGHDTVFRHLATVRVWWYRKIVPLAPAGLQNTGRGKLLGSLSKDIDQLQDYPLRVIQPVVSSALVIAVTVVWVSAFSWPAGLVLVAALVIAGGVSWRLESATGEASQKTISPIRGDLTDAILDSFRRREVLVAFDRDTASNDAVLGLDRALVRAENRFAISQHLAGGVLLIVGGLTVLATAWATAGLYQAGALTGPAFALLALLPLAVVDVFSAVAAVHPARRGVAIAEARLDALVPHSVPPGIPLEEEETEDVTKAPGLVSGLRLDDFTVTWPGHDTPVCSPVSVSLEPGDRLLVTGPSGSGKTSLAHALVAFVTYEGRYVLGSTDASTLTPSALRRHVILIEQSAHLFDTSLRHNLSFAKPDASDDDLWRVIDAVGLGQWARLRGGLDAPVGERGQAVSGGQAQRIALARAFLADAPVLILDEPTAHVDRALADTLLADLLGAARSLRPDGIVIVISHTAVPDEYITKRLNLTSPASAPPVI